MGDTKFSCQHCNQRLEAPSELLGMTIQCPACRNAIVVPSHPHITARPTSQLNHITHEDIAPAVEAVSQQQSTETPPLTFPCLVAEAGNVTGAEAIGRFMTPSARLYREAEVTIKDGELCLHCKDIYGTKALLTSVSRSQVTDAWYKAVSEEQLKRAQLRKTAGAGAGLGFGTGAVFFYQIIKKERHPDYLLLLGLCLAMALVFSLGGLLIGLVQIAVRSKKNYANLFQLGLQNQDKCMLGCLVRQAVLEQACLMLSQSGIQAKRIS